jgi:hypothetical protein
MASWGNTLIGSIGTGLYFEVAHTRRSSSSSSNSSNGSSSSCSSEFLVHGVRAGAGVNTISKHHLLLHLCFICCTLPAHTRLARCLRHT